MCWACVLATRPILFHQALIECRMLWMQVQTWLQDLNCELTSLSVSFQQMSTLELPTSKCDNVWKPRQQTIFAGLLFLNLKVQLPPNFIQWIITKHLSYDRNYVSTQSQKCTSLPLSSSKSGHEVSPNKESTDSFLESAHLAYHSLLKNH